MRACAWICACALLFSGSAFSADVKLDLRIGEILNTRIQTYPHTEESTTCYLDLPTGDTITFTRDESSELYRKYDHDKYDWRKPTLLSVCTVNVVITDTKDEGVWRLHYKTTSGESGEISYKVTVDTAEPTTEATEQISRTIEYLNGQIFNTAIGGAHEVRINYVDFVNTESCHIVTPNGEEYNLEDNSISALGVKAFKDSYTACGVEINVLSEKSVGKWTLFSRDIRFSTPIERRLIITINVEETVRAMPSEVTITAGSDLYVRLEEATANPETCQLIGPQGSTDILYKIDENHRSSCGFIVPDVQMDYSGMWEIVYGNGITYRATVHVDVNAPWEDAATQLEWLKDRPVHMEVGPNNAIYCKITAPEEIAVFETFGRCTIVLERATEQHSGTWFMVVGVPGRVMTEQYSVTVHLKSADTRPQVFTRVESAPPAVLITCAIEGEDSIRSCKFRDPTGKVLMAPQGVGEDRYSFHGVGVSLESNVTKSDCGLRITNPVAEEMGIWRCSVVTYEDQVYHSFLRVQLPWVTADSDSAMTPSEPTLTANHNLIEALEGDAVSMSCSIQSEIQYCYFRAHNGTIFNISPSSESNAMEYIGAGFDAGECGVRFSNLLERDSGIWSCHVGSTTPGAEDEQRATFNVNIQKAITASQRLSPTHLVVEGRVHDERVLEYCRYVRIDGLGFGTFSANLPEQVTIHGDLSKGHCSIHIRNPTTLDRQPWTVVAKIFGQDVEVYDSTDSSQDTPTPPPTPPQVIIVTRNYTWMIFFMLGISMILMSLSMTSKTNRRWVQQRASTLRNSFRKQPLPPHNSTNNTAMAA